MNSIELEQPILRITPHNNKQNVFHVNKHYYKFTARMIRQSKFLKQIIEQTQIQQDCIQEILINETTLNHIYTYLKRNENYPINDDIDDMYQPIQSNILQDIVKEKDYEFIKDIEGDDLFDLANQADYLQIEGLVHLTCTKIATLIKGRTKTEIFERIPMGDKQ